MKNLIKKKNKKDLIYGVKKNLLKENQHSSYNRILYYLLIINRGEEIENNKIEKIIVLGEN